MVASTFVHGRFSLNELSDEALVDPQVLSLASRITDADDPQSGYPHAYSGEVVVRTTSGRELRHREQINRGAVERPIGVADVVDKFMANVELAGMGQHQAQRIVDAVLAFDQLADAADFASLVAGAARLPA